MPDRSASLTSVVVGCRMGAAHARAMHGLTEYKVAGVCDLVEERAQKLAEVCGWTEIHTDLRTMLHELKPDVVTIATPTSLHAELVLVAAEFGPKGIYCEKPMATCLKDAERMVEVCRSEGIALAINHQRRMGPPLRAMRRLVKEGAIGEVTLVRGNCAGDILSDGTHTVDSILHLSGDRDVEWVLGQITRAEPDEGEARSSGYHPSGGWRYGHMVEDGAMASFQFSGGPRAEILTGLLKMPDRKYQDIEVFGTAGRLWHPGDSSETPLLIQTDGNAGWREISLDAEVKTDPDAISAAYGAFARTVLEGTSHPLCGDHALRGFEVLMAIFESARLRSRIVLPLDQKKFPLEL